MQIILAIIAMIISLLLVVGVHEAGHAIVARWFGIPIKCISIGFGPSLLKWQDSKHRDWIWALWPLGGYVQLLNSKIASTTRDLTQCFDKKPVFIRVMILLAGAGANIVMAWLAVTLVIFLGYQQTTPVISSIRTASNAAQAGFQPGDHILSIAGQNTPSWQELGMPLIMHMGKKNVQVLVKNTAGQTRQLSLNLSDWQDNKYNKSLLNSIGIELNSSANYQQQVPGLSFWPALKTSSIQILWYIQFYIVMLKQLLTGAIPFLLLLGPMGLWMTMIHSFLQGTVVFIAFIAHLNLAVALVNLLPIPSLDGGAIVYALIEKLRGKPISSALELLLQRLALIGLSVLFINLFLNDLQRYLS